MELALRHWSGRRATEARVRLGRDLLREGDGPLYAWAEPGTVRRRVRVILDALG